jgi:hypothetical protein
MAKSHVPKLVCFQKYCTRCEEGDINWQRCGKSRHNFWDNPVGDLLTYLCEPRPWANKIVVIAHNDKAFDQHFILKRAIMMKWKPELNTN